MQSEKTKIFIEKARAKHGDCYTYERVEYVTAKAKVIISCKEHGEFSQTPSDHLSGYGCMECGGKMRRTTSSFSNLMVCVKTLVVTGCFLEMLVSDCYIVHC